MLICETTKRIILICVRGRYRISWKERKYWTYVETINEASWFRTTNVIPWSCLLGVALNVNVRPTLRKFSETCFESRISGGATEKLPAGKPHVQRVTWSHVMEWHARKFADKYCEPANKTTQQLYKVPSPCLDGHNFKEEELTSVGELSKVWSQIVLKCLYLGRIGGPDIVWSVNKLAPAVTRWTRACGERLARLISKIHSTSDYRQYFHVGKCCTTMQLGDSFKIPDVAFPNFSPQLQLQLRSVFAEPFSLLGRLGQLFVQGFSGDFLSLKECMSFWSRPLFSFLQWTGNCWDNRFSIHISTSSLIAHTTVNQLRLLFPEART